MVVVPFVTNKVKGSKLLGSILSLYYKICLKWIALEE